MASYTDYSAGSETTYILNPDSAREVIQSIAALEDETRVLLTETEALVTETAKWQRTESNCRKELLAIQKATTKCLKRKHAVLPEELVAESSKRARPLTRSASRHLKEAEGRDATSSSRAPR
ncbi:hypothetical protein C8R43DRAFT_1241272 [Mycena crocata]|nr:hypothetical protein C8R43DRAFT_1241272 [Mycena crocata]